MKTKKFFLRWREKYGHRLGLEPGEANEVLTWARSEVPWPNSKSSLQEKENLSCILSCSKTVKRRDKESQVKSQEEKHLLSTWHRVSQVHINLSWIDEREIPSAVEDWSTLMNRLIRDRHDGCCTGTHLQIIVRQDWLVLSVPAAPSCPSWSGKTTSAKRGVWVF